MGIVHLKNLTVKDQVKKITDSSENSSFNSVKCNITKNKNISLFQSKYLNSKLQRIKGRLKKKKESRVSFLYKIFIKKKKKIIVLLFYF